jgi:hypothetical protein
MTRKQCKRTYVNDRTTSLSRLSGELPRSEFPELNQVKRTGSCARSNASSRYEKAQRTSESLLEGAMAEPYLAGAMCVKLRSVLYLLDVCFKIWPCHKLRVITVHSIIIVSRHSNSALGRRHPELPWTEACRRRPVAAEPLVSIHVQWGNELKVLAAK